MKIVCLLLGIFCLSYTTDAQEIVVSEIYNAGSPTSEWSELLVVSDNVDLRNYTFGDNNSTTNSWQIPITFKNISFWQKMRAGTIIIIRHRGTGASDIDPSDGFLDIDAQNSTYFSGGNANTLDLAAGGDLLRIQNGSGTHVHALGYDNAPGSSWSSLASSSKALMHNNTISSGESIYVCPGATLVDYAGDCAPDCYEYGNTKTARSSSYSTTEGLPNDCGSGANSIFWRSLREPTMASQNYTKSFSGATFNLTFVGATDPMPSDQTQGYIILRKSSNTFTDPTDGTSYNVSDVISGADVVGIIDNTVSATTMSFSTPSVSGSNFYKIYAYRYGDDDANSPDLARGRAYNTTNTALINTFIITPLPLTLLNFSGKYYQNSAQLKWSTSHEKNSKGFDIERSDNGSDFVPFAFVASSKQLKQVNNYTYQDFTFSKPSYYRLRQIDLDSKNAYSYTIYIEPDLKTYSTTIFPNPFTNQFTIETSYFEHLLLTIKDLHGTIVETYQYQAYAPQLIIHSQLPNGMYIVNVQADAYSNTLKLIKNDY